MKALWIVIGGYTAAWGAWLLSPWWGVFSPRAGLYDQMNDFMPEWAWGVHAIVIGVCIIIGAAYRWPRGLWWGRVASTYHWTLIGVFYTLGDWHNTGALTSFAIVVLVHFMWKYTPRTPVVHPLDNTV
jgi:hypothetical protein